MTTPDEYHDELRKLTRQLFGTEEDTVDLSRPAPTTRHVVANEGRNPATPAIHFSDEDHLRQLARELFNPTYAATDPVTFDILP